MRSSTILIISVIVVVACAAAAVNKKKYPEIKPLPKGFTMPALNKDTLTISGISAGAAMAIQFEYAFSSIVHGAGIVAGLPYQCSGGSLAGATECMYSPFIVSEATLLADVALNAELGLIDPVANVANHTVYMFSGLLDSLVPQSMMTMAANMYTTFGINNVVKYFDYLAEHAWITDVYGNSCSTLGSPYINNCGLDFAGNFLQGAFSAMGLKWNGTKGSVVVDNMHSFDQTQFGANELSNSLADNGYVYIPLQCRNATTQCHLHINFHGCEQAESYLGPLYVLETEINEWAESNNIVVIYPQTVSNSLLENPNACFDWWGYAGSNYAQQGGAQISAFRKMISHYGGF